MKDSFLVRKLGVWIFKAIVRLILLSCKVQYHGLNHLMNATKKGRLAVILWHNRLILIADILSRLTPKINYATVVSNSRDGKWIADLTYSYKNGRVISVPHDARGAALVELSNTLKRRNQVVIITPDGPKGPPYKVKQGIAWAAVNSEASVISFSWKSTNTWYLKTWDKMAIPKPFSKIDVFFGEPISFTVDSPLPEALETLENTIPK